MRDHPIQESTNVSWCTDVSWLRDLVLLSKHLDQLDDHIREALNAAYRQGVRDAAEHRDNG